MKHRKITGLLVFAMAAGIAQGATLRYRQSGDWTETAPDDDKPGWRNVAAVPTNADVGRINWGGNTVTVTTAASIGKLQVGVDEQGHLVVANGGSLTTVNGSGENGDVTIGQGNNPAGTGAMTVQTGGLLEVGGNLFHGVGADGSSDVSGTVNVANHLWTGWNSGFTGTINVGGGGVLNVSGMLGLNWQDNGAIGLLNIDDGAIVNLAQIHADGNSIRGDSLLTIAATGMLTKTGNFENVINTQYVDTGKIVGSGGAPLEVSYDPGADLTSVTVIPEPGSLTLLGLAGLGLLARRRRKFLA